MSPHKTPVTQPATIDTSELNWPYWHMVERASEAYIIRCLSNVGGHHPDVSYVHIRPCGLMVFDTDIQWASPHHDETGAKEHALMLADCHKACGSLLMEVFRVELATGTLTKVW